MEKEQRQKYVYLTVIAVLTVLLCGMIFKYRHAIQRQAVSPKAEQKVDVFVPEKRDIYVGTGYIGRVEAINDTKIMPHINGYIVQIPVQGGQDVQEGESLVVLQQSEYLADYVSSEAGFFAAKVDYMNAKLKYKRMKQAGSKVFSQQDIDDAHTAFLVAKSKLRKARSDRVKALTNLNYTVLRAPFAGNIGNIEKSVGDYISPQSDSVMDLIQYNPIRVVFSIPDKEYLNLSKKIFIEGQIRVRAQLSDGRFLPQNGKIKYTANKVDVQTNSVAVYAEFSNTDKLLLPNAYVKIMLERLFKDVLLVERQNVVMRPQGNFIYIVKDNILQLQSVDIEAEKDGYYVIKNNLPENIYIVTQIPDFAAIGKKVEFNLQPKEQ